MSFQEFSVWFSDNVKPFVETFILGLIASVIAGLTAYLAGGGDLAWKAIAVVILTSAGNYVTSRMRRNQAKQLKAQVASDRVQHFAGPDMGTGQPQP